LGVFRIVYVWMAVIQIVYVAMNSLRMVLMIKGWKLAASLISMIEICIYILGLTMVLNQMDTPLGVIIYSASYGIGILIGVYLEEKIAIGYIALQIVTQNGDMPQILRGHKFGVTAWTGVGANGFRTVLADFRTAGACHGHRGISFHLFPDDAMHRRACDGEGWHRLGLHDGHQLRLSG